MLLPMVAATLCTPCVGFTLSSSTKHLDLGPSMHQGALSCLHVCFSWPPCCISPSEIIKCLILLWNICSGDWMAAWKLFWLRERPELVLESPLRAEDVTIFPVYDDPALENEPAKPTGKKPTGVALKEKRFFFFPWTSLQWRLDIQALQNNTYNLEW